MNNNDDDFKSVTSLDLNKIEIMPAQTLNSSGQITTGQNFTIGHAGVNTSQGQMNSGQNTSMSISNGYLYGYPYYQTYYPQYYYTTPWVSINKAENGFIVVKDGKTFICKKLEDLVKLLEEVKK